jgi:hypothetical protein
MTKEAGHISKGKVFKNMKRSPKKKAVLENVYKPIKMNFGEKSLCRDQEKKEEFSLVQVMVVLLISSSSP